MPYSSHSFGNVISERLKNPLKWLESADKHLDSNLSQFFIGGSVAFFYIENKRIVGQIYNETSRNSVSLHALKNKSRIENSKNNKLSTIKQRIYFTFKLPKQ